jgi:hypothetical protein
MLPGNEPQGLYLQRYLAFIEICQAGMTRWPAPIENLRCSASQPCQDYHCLNVILQKICIANYNFGVLVSTIYYKAWMAIWLQSTFLKSFNLGEGIIPAILT